MPRAVHILLATVWSLGFADVSSAAPDDASAARPTASRLVLKVGEQRQVEQPQLQSVVVIDGKIAEVQQGEGAFTVIARTPGQTLAQVFGPAGVHVVVLVVEAPPRPPPSPGADPLQFHTPAPSDRVTSAFGANSSTTMVNVDPWGTTVQETLRFSGRVQEGTYNLDLQGQASGFGPMLQHSRLAWINDKQTQNFELGDIGLRLAGSRSVTGLGLLGLHIESGKAESRRELALGTLRRSVTPRFEPAVMGAVSGQVRTGKLPGWLLSYRMTSTGFSTKDSVSTAERVGLIAGAEATAQHESGYGMTVSTSGQVTGGRQTSSAAGEIAAAAYQQAEGESYRLEYQGNSGRLYSPLAGGELPARQQVSASAGRQLAETLSATASFRHHWLWDEKETLYDGSSFGFGLRSQLTPKTHVGATAGHDVSALPLFLPGRTPTVVQTEVWLAEAQAGHIFSPKAQVLGHLRHERRQVQTVASRLSQAMISGQVAPSARWQAAVATMLTALEGGTLAVDQPPVTFEAGLNANGRYVVARGLDVRGGFSLQQPLTASSRSTQVGANFGVQFMPTTSHLFAATVSTRSPLAGTAWNNSLQVTYTYHFGDDVRERPVFEFLSRSEIEGTVCIDADADGRCGPAEVPVPNVQVRLSNGLTQVTDPQGRYRFEGLVPGFYSVEVDEQALRELGRMTTSSSNAFDLAPSVKQSAVFGVTTTCRIRGQVYDDLDMSRSADPADALVGSVAVTAEGPNGARVTGRTNPLGGFRLDLPDCGQWNVQLDPGSLGPSVAVVQGNFDVTTSSAQPTSVSFLVASLRSVQGTVFIDENRNGVRDLGEPMVPGARVLWARGEAISGSAGNFLLRRLPAGSVSLSVRPDSLPAGLVPGEARALELPAAAIIRDGIDVPVVRAP